MHFSNLIRGAVAATLAGVLLAAPAAFAQSAPKAAAKPAAKSAPAPAASDAGVAAITKTLEQKFPGAAIRNVARTPYFGLYEAQVDEQIDLHRRQGRLRDGRLGVRHRDQAQPHRGAACAS